MLAAEKLVVDVRPILQQGKGNGNKRRSSEGAPRRENKIGSLRAEKANDSG